MLIVTKDTKKWVPEKTHVFRKTPVEKHCSFIRFDNRDMVVANLDLHTDIHAEKNEELESNSEIYTA